MLESLFNNVAGPQACNVIKKRLQHRCFPVNIEKFLRTPAFGTTPPTDNPNPHFGIRNHSYLGVKNVTSNSSETMQKPKTLIFHCFILSFLQMRIFAPQNLTWPCHVRAIPCWSSFFFILYCSNFIFFSKYSVASQGILQNIKYQRKVSTVDVNIAKYVVFQTNKNLSTV